VNKIKANFLLDQFKSALKFYVDYMPKNHKITFIFMSEKDQIWYNEQVRQMEGPNFSDDWWGSFHCSFDAKSHCARGTNAIPENVYYEVIGTEWITDSNNVVNPNHETAHAYQKSIFGMEGYRKYPVWLLEGQANYLGFVTASTIVDVRTIRVNQIRDIKRAFPEVSKFDRNNWLEAINKIESDFDFCIKNGLGYSIGMLISEYLYQNYDFATINNLLLDVFKGLTWDQALIKNLGMNRQNFNLNAADYISIATKNLVF
jgi:hypothetical protein